MKGVTNHPGFNALANKQLGDLGVNPPRIRSTPVFAPVPQHAPTQPPPMKVPAPKAPKGF